MPNRGLSSPAGRLGCEAGEVAVAIDSEADQRGCDLIVLSTHGRSGLRRLVLGSVAEAVLRHAHMPVLAIPPAK